MSNIWKIILLIVIFFAAMLLITLFVPSVKQFAGDMADAKDLPFWLVGLLAPILFVLKKVKDFFLKFGSESKTEKEIRELNEQIKQEMTDLRQDVNNMDAWMRQNVGQELQQITKLKERMSLLQTDREHVEKLVAQIENASPQEFLDGMTDEEIEKEFEKRLVEKGLVEGEPVELVD